MKQLLLSILLFASFLSCARMGHPDGGWYDETPPRVIGSTPDDKGVNVKASKVVINFDEFIKVDNPTEKVVISPPQIEQAEIKAAGKKIVIELKDSLKENTTYTFDFSDAISDNNEGNPMGNYTYSFSTGPEIDTLEVSGTVLNAEDLEPVKGTLVGLYRAEDFDGMGDSAWVNPFKEKPLMRVSRTDGSGRFIIRGIAPGSYRVFALQDIDNNFCYSQAAEALAFNHDVIVPSFKPDTRQDTIWADSVHIHDIIRVPYTHFLPDNIVLRQFVKEGGDRFFLKAERKDAERFTMFFSGPSKVMPKIEGLNFRADSAFIIEASERLDTITYWLRDTALVNQDTLSIAYTFEATDTAGVLAMQTDTLEILAKTPYEKRQKELAKKIEKWKKDLEKRRKKSEEEITDTIYPVDPLKPMIKIESAMSPMGKIAIDFPTPLARMDTAAVHIYVKQEEDWYSVPFVMQRATFRGANDRNYEVIAEWEEGAEYSFEIDSLAFEDIYGLVSEGFKSGLKINTPDQYSSLFVNISGATAKTVIVQLLDNSGKIITSAPATDGTAEFYYIKEGEYYLSCFEDDNENGIWDTGDYDLDRQPENVYYFPQPVECRAKWDVTRSWNLLATPVERQKPSKLVKQKEEKKKTIKRRNAERAEKLGIKLPEEFK